MIGGSSPFALMHSRSYGPGEKGVRPRVDLRRVARYFAPYLREESLALVCILFSGALGLLPPLFTLRIIDSAIPHHDMRELLLDVGGMVASALASAAIGGWQGYLNAVVGEGIMRDMRDALVTHLHGMPLSFFTSTKTGEIMNRVSSDVDAIDNVVTGTLASIVQNVIWILMTVVAIFILNWRLALLSLVVIPIMVVPLNPVGERMYTVRKKTREQRDVIESLIQETLSLSGITLIKSFVREGREAARFHEAGTKLMGLEINLALVGRWFLAIVMALLVIGPAMIWLGGGLLAVRGAMAIGVIVAFVQYLARLYGPASALVGVQVQVVSAFAVFERIFAYLDMTPEVPRSPNAIDLGLARGTIDFERVRFSYTPDRVILDGITLHVLPGQLVALVGPSGAGKTTIANLVPRFYDPQEGSVRVDGHDVRDLTLDSLRGNIGIVTQETFLFHASIADNLRYGKPDASLDELQAACRAANIGAFIESLPDTYDTVVGERGHKLSGGERQRLAIARVLLKDPRILILDEATSSLDSTSEALIQDALVPLMRGRTSLVVAHRLSTILRADVIHVIDRGRVVESGTHTELLTRGAEYAALYAAQFRDKE